MPDVLFAEVGPVADRHVRSIIALIEVQGRYSIEVILNFPFPGANWNAPVLGRLTISMGCGFPSSVQFRVDPRKVMTRTCSPAPSPAKTGRRISTWHWPSTLWRTLK